MTLNKQSLRRSLLFSLPFLFVTLYLEYHIWKERSTDVSMTFRWIAHACGSYHGWTYTNSFEALMSNYRKGYRAFEVDVVLSTDKKLVLSHRQCKQTLKSFLMMKLKHNLTPMSFYQLLLFLRKFPDLIIITDNKVPVGPRMQDHFHELQRLLSLKSFLNISGRIVPQIYHEAMYESVIEVLPVSKILFTLYQRWDGKNITDFESICRWAATKDRVIGLVLWEHLYTKHILLLTKKYHLQLYLHTTNNQELARQFFQDGVTGLYTDSLFF